MNYGEDILVLIFILMFEQTISARLSGTEEAGYWLCMNKPADKKYAVKRQLIYRNPMLSVTNTPKPKKYKSTVYDAEEILQLLEIVKDTVFEVPVALAAVCGLRRGGNAWR